MEYCRVGSAEAANGFSFKLWCRGCLWSWFRISGKRMWWNGAVKRFRIRGKHPWWNEGVERMDDEVEVSLLARFPWGASPYLIGRSGVEGAFWRGLLRFPFFLLAGPKLQPS